MTIEAIINAIARLTLKRQQAHGNTEEQDRINKKLSKLYDIKLLAMQQENK